MKLDQKGKIMAEYVWIDAVGETRSKSRVSPNLSLTAPAVVGCKASTALDLYWLSHPLSLTLDSAWPLFKFLRHEWRTQPRRGRRNSRAALARWFQMAQRHRCFPSHCGAGQQTNHMIRSGSLGPATAPHAPQDFDRERGNDECIWDENETSQEPSQALQTGTRHFSMRGPMANHDAK